jgi:O-antigen/teichoic acid export membrane protein
VLFLAVLRGFWTNYLAGLERYGYATWGVNASQAVQLAALALLWWLAGVSVEGLIGVLASQFVFSTALFLVLERREIAPSLRSSRLPAAEAERMLRFGGWQYASSILMQTNMRANVFLLNLLAGLYETGLYTAVIGPAGFLGLFSSPFNVVLSARTARRHDDPAFPARVAGAIRLMVLLMGAAAVLGAAAAPWALPWVLGPEFRAAVRPFWILLPGVIAYSVVLSVAQYLQGAKRPQLNTLVSLVGAALTLALNLALIPRFGAEGAAVAFSVTFAVSAGVAVWAFLSVAGLRLRQLLVPRRADWEPLGRVLGVAILRRPAPR